MLQRFASAATVGTVLIALATLTVSLGTFPNLEGAYLLVRVWCVVPVVWALWAILIPAGWVPARIPAWGAILGILAGITAAFVLDLPTRVFDTAPSIGLKAGIVILAVVLYGLMWILVREMYLALSRSTDPGA